MECILSPNTRPDLTRPVLFRFESTYLLFSFYLGSRLVCLPIPALSKELHSPHLSPPPTVIFRRAMQQVGREGVTSTLSTFSLTSALWAYASWYGS